MCVGLLVTFAHSKLFILFYEYHNRRRGPHEIWSSGFSHQIRWFEDAAYLRPWFVADSVGVRTISISCILPAWVQSFHPPVAIRQCLRPSCKMVRGVNDTSTEHERYLSHFTLFGESWVANTNSLSPNLKGKRLEQVNVPTNHRLQRCKPVNNLFKKPRI